MKSRFEGYDLFLVLKNHSREYEIYFHGGYYHIFEVHSDEWFPIPFGDKKSAVEHCLKLLA